ncbi:hypothetical protein [Tranquillimonas alkanivorans]|uniref:Uncharacterized protein n=1 Tax=Tranquillimonas alkanivorans TaxID=441119 RepID=A0A1I5U494_9RHOB|nr:hypothetical protein [Tranquillimonas alkanivorans]SFP90104.1 hypothetical protein SAMN04488047_11748 [Tranquillimonas alkanivorans]
MAVPERYRDIDFTPPEEAARAAEKGLDLCDRFDRGGTEAGLARARSLKKRQPLPPEAIGKMVAYFQRHEGDKIKGNFGDDEDPSEGYVAWLLRGGDAGRDWAEEVQDRMEKADAAAAS